MVMVQDRVRLQRTRYQTTYNRPIPRFSPAFCCCGSVHVCCVALALAALGGCGSDPSLGGEGTGGVPGRGDGGENGLSSSLWAETPVVPRQSRHSAIVRRVIIEKVTRSAALTPHCALAMGQTTAN